MEVHTVSNANDILSLGKIFWVYPLFGYIPLNSPALNTAGHVFGIWICGCSIEESTGPQNLWVTIVLKTSKSAGAKGDFPKIYRFVHPLHPC